MEPLRWILLLVGAVLIGGIFCYSRGWYPKFRRPRSSADQAERTEPVIIVDSDEPAPPEPEPEVPVLEDDSRVVAVRIMPQEGGSFPGEQLILALRAAGLRHGRFNIFHCYAEDDERVRFSIASLVEPGSFDLSNLRDSEYRGISVFAIMPAEEDGVQLFDDMIRKAREIAKAIDGTLTDEQGGAFSLQRERYMREDLMEFLRRQEFNSDEDRHTAA